MSRRVRVAKGVPESRRIRQRDPDVQDGEGQSGQTDLVLADPCEQHVCSTHAAEGQQADGERQKDAYSGEVTQEHPRWVDLGHGHGEHERAPCQVEGGPQADGRSMGHGRSRAEQPTE
jgi:hypothetical protein